MFAERVLREVRTGGRLNDPAVVTVYDVVNDGGSTHIVMELVSAPTLSDLVRAHGPLPAAQAAAIGQQVLSALRAAHRRASCTATSSPATSWWRRTGA